MEIVDKFLEALQKIINANETQINDFETFKNDKIKTKNILYTHNITGNDITLDNLFSFNDEEIKVIFACLDNTKKDILYKTYNIYKPLFEMYNKIKDKYNGNFEAPQYSEASKWLDDITTKINSYLKNNQTKNFKYINDLKKQNTLYKKYYNAFNGNALISPIENLKEFSKLLDTLNFNDKEKYQIKKFVGISHIKLLSIEFSESMNKKLDKYQIILKNKKEKYHKAYKKLQNEKELNVDILNAESIKDLSIKYKTGEYEIRQGLTSIFIENVFEDLKNERININNAILELEKILEFSKIETIPKEEKLVEKNEKTITTEKTKKEKNKENKEPKEDKLIIRAKEILKSESEFVNSISEEEFSRYLANSINDNSLESVKYQIVSILLALHGELEKYKNAKDLELIRKQILNNIKEYIEAYNVLKSRLNL